MRILLIPLKKNEGLNLAKALEEYGHNVRCNGITISGWIPLLKVLLLPFISIKELNKSDIIILEAVTLDVAFALFISKVNNIPLIIYSKGFFPAETEEIKPKICGSIVYALNKLSYENSSHILYISNWLKNKYLHNSNLNISNISNSIIHHSIDPFFLTDDELFVDGDNIKLCYTSNFYFYEKSKGGILIIDAFSSVLKKYPHVTLEIIGDGRYKHLLEERVSILNINESVIFKGKINKDELKKCYLCSDLFLYSSALDACPTVVMEAQACGLPTIVTNNSGASELVIDGITGIVCDTDISEIVNSISYLIEQPKIRTSMGIQAKIHVKSNLSWNLTAIKIINSVEHI